MTPPAAGWLPITGTSFTMDWTGAAPGTWYLYQRVSDGIVTVNSNPLTVEVVNSPPVIGLLTADEGPGPFRSDGETTGLTGFNFVNALHITAETSDCDGDDLDLYWAMATIPLVPPQGDPSWNGPISGNQFTVDLTTVANLAPTNVFIFVGVDDGYNWEVKLFSSVVSVYKKLYLTRFTDPSDMWSEHACVTGEGSYSWAHDNGSGYLRLQNYGAESTSAVWSGSVAFPSPPGMGQSAMLMSYVNPALATGFDNAQFGFLREAGCGETQLSIISGSGCSISNPSLRQYPLPGALPIWNKDALVGLYENGLDGCGTSNFYVDWVGIWIKPI
jgi:hypothetical protein